MIRQFPITTSDQWANEATLGLCSPLCADISTTNPSSGMVVSEYGVRQGLNNFIGSNINPVNLGVGEGIYSSVQGKTVELKRLETNNPYRVKFEDNNGNLYITYNGQPSVCVSNDNKYVQGGHQTLTFTVNEFDGGSVGFVNGFSISKAEISANIANEMEAYTDVAIGKIGIRIPDDKSFPNAGEVIHIGTQSNSGQFGYFLTQTASEISMNGEWQPLIYSPSMYTDQYEYFTSNTNIYAYTSGVTLDSTTEFEVKIWYDNVNYNTIHDERVILDSSINNQNNTINKSIVGDGFIDIRWFDGEYIDQFNHTLTNFNILYDGKEYYGDKDNRVRIAVSAGEIVSLYIRTLSSNTGVLTLIYSKETF